MTDWATASRHWPNAASSRFVSAGGIDWHVQVMGSGPTALLIHGTGAASHSWRDLAPLLAPHFTIVAPDLPGHGFTSALRDPTPARVAAALAALIDALALPPALTIGHSVGAAIAVAMADLGLARPRAIVGLGSALLPFPGMAGKLFPGMAKVLFVNPFVPGLFAAAARLGGGGPALVHRMTGSRLDAASARLYERLFRDADHVAGALALMASWDLFAIEAALPGLDLPVLLAHGSRDTTIEPATSRTAAARLPDAQTRFFPGLGHLAHEEAPSEHATMILDFARARGIIGG